MKKILTLTIFTAIIFISHINAQEPISSYDEIIEGKVFDEGLVVENKENVLIRNCTISNRSGKVGLKINGCKNVRVENSVISGVGNESFLSYDNTYSKVRKHIFLPLLQNQGVLVEDSFNVLISGCKITDIFGMGILVTGKSNKTTSNITIEDNRIAYVYADGIKFGVEGDQNQPAEIMPFQGGIIRNNTIHNVALGVAHLGFACHGMYLKAADILVEGNNIYNVFYGEGVSLRNAGIIRDNTIWNCARACIAYWQQTNTADSSKTVIIENNKLRQEYAISFPMRHALRPQQLHYLPVAVITAGYGKSNGYAWIDNYIIRNNECFVYSDYDADVPIIRFGEDPSKEDPVTQKTAQFEVSENLIIDNREKKNYYQNVPAAKDNWQADAWTEYADELVYDWSGDLVKRAGAGKISDFSYAGYGYGDKQIPKPEVAVDVTDFGAVADDGKDDRLAFQAAVDFAGSAGGGVVYIPAGRYHFNVDASKPFASVVIKYSNVVIRGAGSGKDGSIIHLCNMADEKGWGGDSFLLTTKAIEPKGKKDINIVEPAFIGDRELIVDNTDWLNEGDFVLIELHNPVVEPNKPLSDFEKQPKPLYSPPRQLERGASLEDTLKYRSDKLSREVTYPLEPENAWKHYARFAPIKFLVEIVEISDTTVRLAQPLRFDVETEWTPTINAFEYIEGVGVEQVRFESSWQGPYSHHGNWEMDYGWAAVAFDNVVHGWIRDVEIQDYTLDLQLQECKNVTVENIKVTGLPGHNSIHITGWDNMITDCVIDAERTHAIGTGDSTSGNVFRKVRVLKGRGEIDSHGGNFPMKNLFELIENAHISSGGHVNNMPHSGRGNVYWNIIICDNKPQIKNELFNGYYNYWGGQRELRDGKWRTDCHKLYPGSIIVGVYKKDGIVEIDQKPQDRDDQWIYAEGLNLPGVYPQSLYDAQYKLRKEIERKER